MSKSTHNALILLWLCLLAAPLSGDMPIAVDDKIDFANQIAPIFENHCFECHGENVREGGLRITNRRDAMADNDSGSPAIVPGKIDESLILNRVASHDESTMMPPVGGRLSAKEIALIKQWIVEGAVWPESEKSKHWAYVAPRQADLPEVNQADWPRNAIDYFVLQQLEQNGLGPSAESEPARLLRRVSLALTGLPPAIEQVDQFLLDPSPVAYERFVDQCLESPRYGERWAQPWLDLARYADSNGYQADQLRNSWAYRDWVIHAMNADMPFDQFTIEQLAGDLLPNATIDQKIATGFHRTVTCNVEAGVHPEENRVNQIFDRVDTTGTVFLGTTIECCQCHNHKYDPFTQDEYYQLFAFFNNTPLEVKLNSGVQYNFYGPTIDLPMPEKDIANLTALKGELARLEEQKSKLDAASEGYLESSKQRLLAAIQSPVEWQPLTILDFDSTGGESFKILDDQSVLIGGSLPDTTVYDLKAASTLDKITAFRLEALTHESLPGTGPGRGDEKRANFILSEFSVSAELGAEPSTFEQVKLTNPTADFSQDKWDVANSIDGDLKTGWAVSPKFFEPHWAVYEVASPVDRRGEKTEFRFLLDQNYGRGRTLGRIRISATTAGQESLSIPDEIKSLLLNKQPNKKQIKKLEEYLESSDPIRTELNQQIAVLRKQIEEFKPPTSLVMVEMDEMRETFKLRRGNYLTPGKKVSAASPTILHAMDQSLPRNRLGLAKWIADPANPLIGRVTVNRWWSNFFGHGLVRSEEDLGTQSDFPTHPELLDWLAMEFVEHGWSRKHIHKMIVMSATFRQSAKLTSELIERDPKNKKYARGPRFRMPAEMIRDNGLAVSGLLSEKMGGPSVMPYQPENIWRAVGRNAPKWKAADDEDRNRRGVYVVWRRAAPYPSFVNFDAPDRGSCVVRRPRTNTPLQALTLLNDQAYIEMAIALVLQVCNDNPKGSPTEKITAALRRCVSRVPEQSEIDELLTLYTIEHSRFLNSLEDAKKLLKVSIKNAKATDSELAQQAALTIVANVILNLDETINY